MKNDLEVTCKKEDRNNFFQYIIEKKNPQNSFNPFLDEKNVKQPVKQQMNDSDFQLNEQGKPQHKISSYKRWKRQENSVYLKFLINNKHMFKNQHCKRKFKVFKKLSLALQGKKTISQCKSHHQKMTAYTKNQDIDQIINYMLTKSKFYSNLQKSNINEQLPFKQIPELYNYLFAQKNKDNLLKKQKVEQEHCQHFNNFLLRKSWKEDNGQYFTNESQKYQDEQGNDAGDVNLRIFSDGKIEIQIKLNGQQLQIW